MNERRKNWKIIIPNDMDKVLKRQELLTQLENIRTQLQGVGVDFEKYDALKLEQRITTAKLATL